MSRSRASTITVAALAVAVVIAMVVAALVNPFDGDGGEPPAVSTEAEPPRRGSLAHQQGMAEDCRDAWAAQEDLSPLPRAARRSISRVVRAVSERVAEIRELPRTRRLDVTFLPPDEQARVVRGTVQRSLSSARADETTRLLMTLGMLDRGAELEDFIGSVVGGIVGLYKPRPKKLFVATQRRGSLDPADESTLAHEVQHALVDRSFDLDPLATRTRGRSDRAAAFRSLVEGDATLTQMRYVRSVIPPEDRIVALGGSADAQARARKVARLPHVLQRSLSFPYTDGLGFVCHLFASGGWRAVDRAYRKPPATTAQIVWPDLYTKGVGARRVPRSPGLRPPWEKVYEDQLGAVDLLIMFEAPGDDVTKALADPYLEASRWAGGEVRMWTRGPDTAVQLALAERARGLCDAMKTWYERSFPEARAASSQDGEAFAAGGARHDAVVTCAGDIVRVGVAPSLGAARKLAS